jgi:hypothetical protein
MNISHKALQEAEEALRVYEKEIQSSHLAPVTKHTYLLHSTNFVRWLKDDFVPGERKD